MKKIGYGKEHKYPHYYSGRYVKENYFPEKLKGGKYYHLTQQGEEAKISQRLLKLRGSSSL